MTHERSEGAGGTTPLEIQYESRRRDVLIAALQLVPRIRANLYSFLFLFALMTFQTWRHARPGAALWAIVVTGFIFSGAFYVLGILGLLTLGALRASSPSVVGTKTIRVQDDGLFEKTAVDQSLHAWRGIVRVESIGSYLYVHVGTYGKYYAIRHSAFASPAQLQEFQRQIRARAASAAAAT